MKFRSQEIFIWGGGTMKIIYMGNKVPVRETNNAAEPDAFLPRRIVGRLRAYLVSENRRLNPKSCVMVG